MGSVLIDTRGVERSIRANWRPIAERFLEHLGVEDAADRVHSMRRGDELEEFVPPDRRIEWEDECTGVIVVIPQAGHAFRVPSGGWSVQVTVEPSYMRWLGVTVPLLTLA